MDEVPSSASDSSHKAPLPNRDVEASVTHHDKQELGLCYSERIVQPE